MATVSPVRAPLLRNALKVVTPAQSSGAASVAEISVGNPRERRGGNEHVFRVAAVAGEAGNLPPFAASHEIAAAAGIAVAAMPAVPADSGALSHFPAEHARADGVDHAGDLVSWNARVSDAGARTFLGVLIAVADAAGLHLDAHRSGGGLAGFRDPPVEKLRGHSGLERRASWA